MPISQRMDRDHGKTTTTSGICESFWLECFSIDFLDNFGDQCIYGGHLASSQSFDSVFVPFFVLFSVYTFPNLGIELGREAVGKWLLIENFVDLPMDIPLGGNCFAD